MPDVFASFDGRQQRRRLLPAQRTLYREALELHPQYIIENGVDFAHFKFVHKTPIVPVFTRQDFDGPVSYVDFTITFEGDDGQSIEDINSGVEAINGGLGIAVTKSWGMVDNRTISAITPVDEPPPTSVSWCTSAASPATTGREAATQDQGSGDGVIEQFAADIQSGRHQRYSDPPALSTDENKGFTALRKWAEAVLSGQAASPLREASTRDERSSITSSRSASSRWRRAMSAPR